jgi:hypothetical protein
MINGCKTTKGYGTIDTQMMCTRRFFSLLMIASLLAGLNAALSAAEGSMSAASASAPAATSAEIGVSPQPGWILDSDLQGAELGHSVALAGDLNADGYADVLVGAPKYGAEKEGAVFVFYGTLDGLPANPDKILMGAYKAGRFGDSVASAGDVNHDGYADIIIGAPGYDGIEPDTGAILVYHGSASGLADSPALTVVGQQKWGEFGNAVAGAGDVNGDSFADVIAGEHYYTNGQVHEGRAHVFFGSPSGVITSTAWTYESDQSESRLGAAVAAAGDINHDGLDDIIIGAPSFNNDQSLEGRAFVFYSRTTGFGQAPDWFAEGNATEAWFGWSVGTAGDVNGDGYADVLIGAPNLLNSLAGNGAVFAYHGSSQGLGASPDWTGEVNQDNSFYGCQVGPAGDINQDGYDDILIGAFKYEAGSQQDEGGAFIHYGGLNGLSSLRSWWATGGKADAWFGYSASIAGDINGDSYLDVIVGAPTYKLGTNPMGRASVFYGGERIIYRNHLPLVLGVAPVR